MSEVIFRFSVCIFHLDAPALNPNDARDKTNEK
jgi:hypothetical protein